VAASAVSTLRELERSASFFGAGAPKLELLHTLERKSLPRARDVERLHDLLCFLRAWPDGPELLAAVERMLARFDRRPDLRRHRTRLVNSGIAGTETRFRFFAATARWLARAHPDRLRVDWPEFEQARRLEDWLSLFAHYAESPGLDAYAFPVRRWIERMKGPTETDGAFLVHRLDALAADGFLTDTLYEELDPPLRLLPGPATPARTREKLAVGRVAYQTDPLDRQRPDLRRALRAARPRFRALPPREARRVIALARGAMACRQRDLDAFGHADEQDVRRVRCGDGVEVALLGVVPARRFLLETLYGYLLLKNGVLVGYGTGVGLFRSVEVAFNLFPPFRGGDTARLYAHVLGVFAALYEAETFVVDPYQIGQDNQEALRSGAWWFYAKLGFRPRDAATLRLAQQELRAKKRRTPIATLRRLAQVPLFFDLGRRRKRVACPRDLGPVGLAVTDFLARRFGARREEAARTCAREAAALLGARSTGRTRGERLAWERWGPLVLVLPGVARWKARERQALARVVRAKGGRRESDYTRLFDGHQRLRRAVAKLAAES
jgi:hypothetical protein